MKKMLLLLAVVVSVAACGNKKTPEASQASLQNTKWVLKAIDGVDVAYPAGAKPADMLLEEGTNQVSGFGGCNRYFGGYESDGNAKIKFTQMGATQMACSEGMEVEGNLLRSFEQINTYAVEGETLYLKNDSKVVLTFTVVKEE